MIRNTLLLSLAFLAAGLSQAEAGLVTYSETADIFATFGQGIPQSNVLTITLTVDQDDPTGVATFAFGNDVGTILAPTTFVLDQTDGIAGFEAGGVDLISVLNPAFAGYDGSAPFGPVSGQDGGSVGTVATSIGVFTMLTPIGPATFTASPAAAVPEPSSLALTSVAAVLAMGWARSRCGKVDRRGV